MALLATSVALVAAAACDDPFAARANTQVRSDTFVVFASSGTQPNLPSAFDIVFFVPVRIEPTFAFDFAFDIDDAGQVHIIPVRLMGGLATANRRLGLQKVATPFDDLSRAPNGGYQYDSVLVLNTRETAAMELLADECTLQISQLVYSKLEILVIDPVRRILSFRITYDPNCGFRSFLPGIPKD